MVWKYDIVSWHTVDKSRIYCTTYSKPISINYTTSNKRYISYFLNKIRIYLNPIVRTICKHFISYVKIKLSKNRLLQPCILGMKNMFLKVSYKNSHGVCINHLQNFVSWTLLSAYKKYFCCRLKFDPQAYF